jgi:hypothetical protein
VVWRKCCIGMVLNRRPESYSATGQVFYSLRAIDLPAI